MIQVKEKKWIVDLRILINSYLMITDHKNHQEKEEMTAKETKRIKINIKTRIRIKKRKRKMIKRKKKIK